MAASSPLTQTPRLGLTLARLLAGTWRPGHRLEGVTAEQLELAAPRLLLTGTAGLVWESLRHTPLAALPAAQGLCQQHRRQALLKMQLEYRLPLLFEAMRRDGFDPLLIKGWSVLRVYPGAGQRPTGDIDLCVPPEQFRAARRWLEQHAEHAQEVDLHEGVPDLDDRPWEGLWQRSVQPLLRDVPIRVLGSHDQLQLLCLHFARHGGWRPLWLCDVAALAESMASSSVETRSELAGTDVSRLWVRCVLSLAARLLQATVSDDGNVPHWIVSGVLRAWEADRLGDSHSRDDRPLRDNLARPLKLWQALWRRWPNPIEAAFKMGAPPSTRWPCCWHQFRYALRRSMPWPRRQSSLPAGNCFAIHVKG